MASTGAFSPRKTLQLALAAQADPASLGHDQMVQQGHPEQGSALDQAPRDLPILQAGSWVATRVVVHHHERRSSLAECRPEHLPWVDQAGRERPSRRHHLPQHAVATVEEQQVELLVRDVPKSRVEVLEHVLGAADQVAMLESVLRQPAPQLECRKQRRRLGWPDPLVLLELGRECARESPQALASEQRPSQRLGGAASDPGSQQQGQQLDIVERLGAARAKTLPRASPSIGSLHDGLSGTRG